jgi:hypothetical protein
MDEQKKERERVIGGLLDRIERQLADGTDDGLPLIECNHVNEQQAVRAAWAMSQRHPGPSFSVVKSGGAYFVEQDVVFIRGWEREIVRVRGSQLVFDARTPEAGS